MLFKYQVPSHGITKKRREVYTMGFKSEGENGEVLWLSFVTKRYQPNLKEDFITQLNVVWNCMSNGKKLRE